VIRFVGATDSDSDAREGLHATLRALMAGFALAWEVA
jgi:hypothetical protein